MLKVHAMNSTQDNDYPIYIRFSEIIRIELLEREVIEIDSKVHEWTMATVHTRDGQSYTAGIVSISKLVDEFNLDLDY